MWETGKDLSFKVQIISELKIYSVLNSYHHKRCRQKMTITDIVMIFITVSLVSFIIYLAWSSTDGNSLKRILYTIITVLILFAWGGSQYFLRYKPINDYNDRNQKERDQKELKDRISRELSERMKNIRLCPLSQPNCND